MKNNKILFSENKKCAAELIINVSQIKTNIRTVKSLVGSETKIMFVVKASAYGFGAQKLTQLLEQSDEIDYLAVANSDEGRELRNSNISLPILVLNPLIDSLPHLIKYNLEAEVYSLDFLKSLSSELNRISQTKPFPIHIKFNTGMNRLGINENEIPELLDLIKKHPFEVKSIMTHLSSAGKADEDEFTNKQIDSFNGIIANLKDVTNKDTLFHALNSYGSLRFSKHHYDMVRIGIAAYGGVNSESKDIRSAIVFNTKIIQVRRVKKGDSISYDRSGRVNEDKNIACVSIGYGDGFSRNLGNGKWEMEINGKLYPTIGNICMDLTMVDIGQDMVMENDDVILFGNKKSLFEYAKASKTIPYEVLTSLNRSIKRTYVESK